jgi:hypothetical protein
VGSAVPGGTRRLFPCPTRAEARGYHLASRKRDWGSGRSRVSAASRFSMGQALKKQVPFGKLRAGSRLGLKSSVGMTGQWVVVSNAALADC